MQDQNHYELCPLALGWSLEILHNLKGVRWLPWCAAICREPGRPGRRQSTDGPMMPTSHVHGRPDIRAYCGSTFLISEDNSSRCPRKQVQLSVVFNDSRSRNVAALAASGGWQQSNSLCTCRSVRYS